MSETDTKGRRKPRNKRNDAFVSMDCLPDKGDIAYASKWEPIDPIPAQPERRKPLRDAWSDIVRLCKREGVIKEDES